MTAALSLADAQALAARATGASWRRTGTAVDRDRDAIASALRRLERHQNWRHNGVDSCRLCGLADPCPDYLDATTDLLRHCAPYVEVPS